MKIEKVLFIFTITSLFILIFSSFVNADNCGGTVQCHCGDILVESQVMWYDLIDCPIDGLIIGANGITLDCDGHLIDSDGSGTSDIGLFIYDSEITITNCNIQEFYSGIGNAKGSDNNIITYNTVNDNRHDGIGLIKTFNNIVYANTLIDNQIVGIFIDGISNDIWDNVFINNGINAYDSSGDSNNWNVSDVGNYWSDFTSNPGYPNYYEIPGSGLGIDWHPSFVEFYVDNSDEEFVIFSGTWNLRHHYNAYNNEVLYNNRGFGLERAGWKVNNLVFPGIYAVYVWKFEHEYSNRMGTNVHYMVYHRTGTSNWILVDQSTPGNEWVYLGEFEFDDSHGQGVMITDEANGYIAADAIKLVYTGPLTDAESSGAEVFLI